MTYPYRDTAMPWTWSKPLSASTMLSVVTGIDQARRNEGTFLYDADLKGVSMHSFNISGGGTPAAVVAEARKELAAFEASQDRYSSGMGKPTEFDLAFFESVLAILGSYPETMRFGDGFISLGVRLDPPKIIEDIE